MAARSHELQEVWKRTGFSTFKGPAPTNSRSVQMTALSFVIGVLPLLFATGAGANSRHAVGVATFWGMLTATLVGMLFVPPLYVLFRRLAGAKASSI